MLTSYHSPRAGEPTTSPSITNSSSEPKVPEVAASTCTQPTEMDRARAVPLESALFVEYERDRGGGFRP